MDTDNCDGDRPPRFGQVRPVRSTARRLKGGAVCVSVATAVFVQQSQDAQDCRGSVQSAVIIYPECTTIPKECRGSPWYHLGPASCRHLRGVGGIWTFPGTKASTGTFWTPAHVLNLSMRNYCRAHVRIRDPGDDVRPEPGLRAASG